MVKKKFGERSLRKLQKIRERLKELISIPVVFISVVVLKILMSFTSWIRAILLTWGFLDGMASNYIYKEEKFFPYQFLRYMRIAANLSGVMFPIIPVVWNIGDGMYSLYLYRRKAHPVENLSRYGRVLNGTLLAILS